MRYFITGATGFVGGVLARLLLASGHQVNALARDPARAAGLESAGAAVFAGDITDRDSLHAPMAGVDGLFHVAGWYRHGARHGRQGQRINVDGTRNVLEVMRELGVPRGVYTSSLVANSDTRGHMADESYRFDGRHISEYDRTKTEAHHMAQEMAGAGLPLIILLPGMIYGPGDTSTLRTSIHMYLQRRLPMLPQRQAMCWAHVDDIAQIHARAMEHGKPGEAYIIAGPPHTVIEFYEIAEALTGIPAPRLRLPPQLIRAMAAMVGPLEKLLPLPDHYSAEYLRSLAGVTYLGDNSRAKRELGYDPRPLRQGLEETLRHEMESLGMNKRRS